jgi:formylglycine-generating enzyme required for sulfatase activity
MDRWNVERAQTWHRRQPWLVGCNFLPSTAINQLEMWQADTYDPATIDRELGWAEGLGFNTVRVYLHDLVWRDDGEGFAARIGDFLGIAGRHGMKALLTLFDDCHRPDPASGTQPLPVAGVHNSGWKHSPGQALVLQFHEGAAPAVEVERLREYVQGVLTRFAGDDRILMWDVYNEAGNSGNGDRSHELLRRTWDWAQAARPSQPLTACLDGSVGEKIIALNAERSDIITFHGYSGEDLEPAIVRLKAAHGSRPLLCTEYMARELGTTFQHSLPIFKKHGVGCLNWGLVAGKSQTHFNWQTVARIEELRKQGAYLKAGDAIPEPPLWFHDIFRVDGTPFDPAEVEFIRGMTGAACSSGAGEGGLQADPANLTEMVYIPAGEFLMGTSEQDARRLAAEYGVHPDLLRLESPQRTVELKAFWIDRHPVTYRQFAEFADAAGFFDSPEYKGSEFVKGDKPWPLPYFWTDGRIPAGQEDYAIVDVPWAWAAAYARWAGKRLPTAEEWEKAARGTDGRLYPWGNEWQETATHRRAAEAFMPPCMAEHRAYSLPVGCYPEGASPYGVTDLCGNVLEWTATPSTPGLKTGQQGNYVVKGASAAFREKVYFRCASVAFNDTSIVRGGKGFRCVKESVGPAPESARLSAVPKRVVPAFPQPKVRAELYGKEPLRIAGGPGPRMIAPYLPDGHLGLIAPEGMNYRAANSEQWLPLRKRFATGSVWKAAPDGAGAAYESYFKDPGIRLRLTLSSGGDYVDYAICMGNESSAAVEVGLNTCMACSHMPYFYDPEDARTFIFTDQGARRLLECPPFKFEGPLYRGWGIAPEGVDTARLPLACTVSSDGRWTLAVAAAVGTGIARNANYSCLHLSQVWPVLAPGAQHTVVTRYYVIRGGAGDALARWRKDFGPARP